MSTSWLTKHTQEICIHSTCQSQGYSSVDEPESPQVAISVSILSKFYQMSISPEDKALCELFIGAFFFCHEILWRCQSIRQKKNKTTHPQQYIRFLKGTRTINHWDPLLHLADCVTITFEHQKHDTKNDMITQHWSSDTTLCPVRIWASIVQWVHSYSPSSIDSSVNSFLLPKNEIHHFMGTELLKRLYLAMTLLDPDTLGFTADQIGLHSVRSGAAMAMYLAGDPVFTIMLLSR